MDFNEKGFLGKAIAEFAASVESRYSEFFDACYRINELAHATKFELQAHNRDGQETLAASVFIRLHNGFQGTVILARLGLVIEAKVVLRAILESLFILKLLCEDEEFFAEYIRSDQFRRLQWMNIAHESNDPNFEALRKHATDDVMEALRQEVAKHDCKKIVAKEIARRANLLSMYDADYRLLSEEVHTLPRSLEHLTSADASGDIVGFEWGPSDEGLDYILFTAVRVLLIALVSVTKLFDVGKSDELLKVDQTLTKLALLLRA